MPEDIRLAKGEDLDALEDIVNNHIGSDETHVTAGDKQNLKIKFLYVLISAMIRLTFLV